MSGQDGKALALRAARVRWLAGESLSVNRVGTSVLPTTSAPVRKHHLVSDDDLLFDQLLSDNQERHGNLACLKCALRRKCQCRAGKRLNTLSAVIRVLFWCMYRRLCNSAAVLRRKFLQAVDSNAAYLPADAPCGRPHRLA